MEEEGEEAGDDPVGAAEGVASGDAETAGTGDNGGSEGVGNKAVEAAGVGSPDPASLEVDAPGELLQPMMTTARMPITRSASP